ncbi:DGQHR domain-containing protein [Listeria booriae]|uniref:DGQHR domain-containing protein n=1 Tax=Listeria booriae TaxID=1552123 RepID=UPI001C8BABA2|nr:DGQHR domain-containing protein [Listeria booriae]
MSMNENVVFGKELLSVKRQKSASYLYTNVNSNQLEEYETLGWEIDKKLKHSFKLKKSKPLNLMFENLVWLTFCNLGFQKMNKTNVFKIPCSTDPYQEQDFDIFAADEETALCIKCYSTEDINKQSNFINEINAIGKQKRNIITNLNKNFPSSKLKVKFIFATKNYNLSPEDKKALNTFDIEHFDEEIVEYYSELSKHLGPASRYQLLGSLFENQKIDGINNEIPAIMGTMGGHTYYSFSIEPEKLLKLGFVLHRNNANKNSMPAYQRIIKKQRLTQVQEFVNTGGFFPNSIVINIDTKSKGLRFDISSMQEKNSVSKLGILHLPKKYKSIYIIDGQHRLYGYSGSEYRSTNSIPVVAFLDLKKQEQVKLFMEINENQKAVSKNLRNTLNSDLLWSSSSYIDQRRALSLKISQSLGEDRNSPLYNRVIIGENSKTPLCCITIDTIKTAIDKSDFLSTFNKKNEIIVHGTFDKGTNDATYDILYPFLLQCLEYIAENSREEWLKGESDNGALTINVGIYGLILVINDIVNHLLAIQRIAPIYDPIENIISQVIPYLNPIIEYSNSLSIKDKIELRTSYGGNGKTKYWRKLQLAIATQINDFEPHGFLDYWENNQKKFNEESFKMIRDIEKLLKKDFEEKLSSLHGENWFMNGVPKNVYDSAIKLAADKNYANKDSNTDAWDCLHLINYRDIALHGSNWRDLFEKSYTKPGEEKLGGGKKAKTEWMQKLNGIRNQNFHEYSVTVEEHDFLLELTDWLLPN